MARLKFSIPTSSTIALSAATAKTILQARTPTNQAVAFRGFAVSFDGDTGSNKPVLVELCRYSSNGTMTSAAGIKDDPGRGETIQTGAFKNATLEPAPDTSIGNSGILRQWHVHPQTGYDRMFDDLEEIIIPGGTRFGLRCTAPDAVNAVGQMNLEE